METRKTVRRRRGDRDEAGFTLLELLVVMIILTLLATIAAPQVLSYLGGARTDTARIQISNLGTALDLYRLDAGRYPTSDEGLRALVERPQSAERWRGPYVKKKDSLIDPWGAPYVYVSPGRHGTYDLSSLGADRAEGGADENQDVTSW
jgi:general secretion pathway protein G